MPTSDPGRWNLSDVDDILDNTQTIDNPILRTLREISKILEEEKNSNFILGKVIIDNDLLEEDDEDDDHNAEDD